MGPTIAVQSTEMPPAFGGNTALQWLPCRRKSAAPCSPLALISAPVPSAPSWSDAPTAGSLVPASPITLAAAKACCWTRATTIWPASIRAIISSASRKSVKGALREAKQFRGFDAAKVVGLGVDTTGSSPIPVDRNNVPLALDPKWREKPRRAMLAVEGPHRLARSRRNHRPRRASTARSTSPNAATPTPPSGGGRKSGTA